MLTYLTLAQSWKLGNKHWHNTINQWWDARAVLQGWERGNPDL